MSDVLSNLSNLLDVPGAGRGDARRRKLLNVLLLGLAASGAFVLVLLLVTVPLGVAGSPGEVRLLLVGTVTALVGVGIIYGLNRYVSGDLAAVLFVLLIIALGAISDDPRQVVSGRGLLVFALPILAASALLRPWASFLAAAASLTVVVAVSKLVVGQPVPNLPAIPIFFMLALIAWLSGRSLEQALENLRASNRRLKESEERYRLHFENVSDVIYAMDRDLRITDVSPSVEMVLGYKPEELVGESLLELDVVAPESLEQAVSDTMAVVAGERVSSSVYQFIAKDGARKWGEVSGAPIIRDGQVVGLVAVARDITERRRMEEQLRQQERLAAVGQLAGGIAHDFNNILASIILYAQMGLRRSDLHPGTKDALETILDESRRAADLVQQILDFSRKAVMETQPVSLGALVRETSTLLRRTIPENVRLVTGLESRSCTVQADPTRIHQALMNLALNAKDAMPEGGELRIRVACETVAPGDVPPLPAMEPGGWARLTVSDTGTGMSQEAQEHLFEPFFTTKEQGKGTGLGLAQVYGIVKQHRGFIDVETARGEGTTFTIFLPLMKGDEENEHRPGGGAADGEDAPAQDQDETILVVEDADPLRGAIEAGLTSRGYRVISTADGREALDAVAEQRVDLVLTDVVMPHMGGEALLQALRAADARLPVIAMTGHLVDTDVEGLRSAGFAAALSKPFSIEALIGAVRDVLARESEGR
jgi:PAS domain S-box-containing protein